jgi:Uma2 family endonuclease
MNAEPWSGRLLTLADWEALPEDNSRHYELARGVLEGSPKPVSEHQRVVFEVAYQLRSQLPPQFVIVPEVEVIISLSSLPTVRAPDVSVVTKAATATKPARYRACDVFLAIEALSPKTARTDREVKFFEYADAGIEHYWIVDTEEPKTLTAYRLVDGEYELMAQGTKVTLTEPAPITIDLTSG